MPVSSFVLLVSETLRRHLVSISRRELGRIRKKFEFLASGLWEGGLKVKKLKGARAVVFEARMNDADRLLFTLGREEDTARIYAWGIERHDDVNRAKAVIDSDSVPFLSFETLDETELNDVSLDDLDSVCYSQEAFEGLANEDYGPQRWRILEDTDWERLLSRAEGEEVDFRLHLTERQRQALLDEPPLLLSGTAGSGKTTIAVYYLFRKLPGVERRLFLTWHPFLADHSARLYKDLARGNIEAPKLAPRFSTWRGLVRDILGKENARFAPEHEADLHWFELELRARKEFSDLDPDFVWEEIRGIIKGSRPSVNIDRLTMHLQALESGKMSSRDRMELLGFLESAGILGFAPKLESFLRKQSEYGTLGEFIKAFSSPGAGRQETAVALFRLALEQVKKHRAMIGRSMLPLGEYQALGTKRAPRFSGLRERIHAVAEWYEERLRELGRWDDIDLTRAALEKLDSEAAGWAGSGSGSGAGAGAGTGSGSDPARGEDSAAWDLIVCDEVQDFTNVHLQLLFRLVSDPSRLVLVGDVKQTINPSGFRWADVRSLFWDRGMEAPELLRLDFNFRSVGGIVALGNALLDVKKNLAGIESEERKERWKFTGLVPCLLEKVKPDEVAKALPQGGAADAIITRDSAIRDRVKALTKNPFVFTIAESKGLEFDSILLWRLTPDEGELAGLWRRLLNDSQAARGFEFRIIHEINQYYVAATRARHGLVIFETNTDFWRRDEFAGLLIPGFDASLVKTYQSRISTHGEWKKRGDYYAARSFWLQAAECYRNAEEPGAEALAKGKFHLASGEYEEAALCFESAQLLKDAAEAWEQAGAFDRAENLWTGLGEVKRSTRCRALGCEKAGNHAEAADAWLRLKNKEAAARCLEKAEIRAETAALFQKFKLWPKAAEAWLQGGHKQEAAQCFSKASLHLKAAAAFESAGDIEHAILSLRKARDFAREKALLKRQGRFDLLAKKALTGRDWTEATELFSAWIKLNPEVNAPGIRAEAEALLNKKPLEAAVRFAAMEEYALSGLAYEKAKHWTEAALVYRAGKIHDAAEHCWVMGNEHEAAGLEREAAGLHDWKTVLHFRRSILSRSGTRLDQSRVKALEHAIIEFKKRGLVQQVLTRYMTIFDVKGVESCLPCEGRGGDAFIFLSENKAVAELDRLLETWTGLELDHDFIMEQAPTETDTRDSLYTTTLTIAILRHLTRRKDDPGAESPQRIQEIDAYLPDRYTLMYSDIVTGNHLDILEYLIRIQNLNALYWLWFFNKKKKGQDYPLILEMKRRLLAIMREKTPRSELFKALVHAMNGEADIPVLSVKNLSPWTTIPFLLGSEFISEALTMMRSVRGESTVEYLFGILHMESLAGVWHEGAGRTESALSWYAKARKWNEVLRLARNTGNQVYEARALEKTGKKEAALRLWEQLGRTREVERVRKALERAASEGAAMEGNSPRVVEPEVVQPEVVQPEVENSGGRPGKSSGRKKARYIQPELF